MTKPEILDIMLIIGIFTIEKGEEMPDKDLEAQSVAIDEGRQKAPKRELTLWQAITMSIVAILAVAVGTIYGTILF